MMKSIGYVATFLALSAVPACASSSNVGEFDLSSPDVAEGVQLTNDHVFNGFGCEGGNISPALSWLGAPEGTKSFVITAYDPDAPTGSGWWHWVSFNIPADTTSIPANASAEGAMPEGTMQSRTDFGATEFGGACPPPGVMHRYEFTIHALDVEKLDLDETASPALVGFMTNAHTIDSDKITAVYTRK